MTRRRGRRMRIALVLACALCSLPGLSLVTRALQSGEISPPRAGTRRSSPRVSPRCRTRRRGAWFSTDRSGGAAELSAGGPGFILCRHWRRHRRRGRALTLLAPAEAAFHASPTSRLIPIGERPTGVFALDLVPPDAVANAGDGIPVFASDLFSAPDGTRDIDLVRDLLSPASRQRSSETRRRYSFWSR